MWSKEVAVDCNINKHTRVCITLHFLCSISFRLMDVHMYLTRCYTLFTFCCTKQVAIFRFSFFGTFHLVKLFQIDKSGLHGSSRGHARHKSRMPFNILWHVRMQSLKCTRSQWINAFHHDNEFLQRKFGL